MLRIDNGSSVYIPRAEVTDEDTKPQSTSATQTPATPPTTPQQRVDQAVAAYDSAVTSDDPTAIDLARQGVYTAVAAEIGPQVDAANAHVPAEFQPPLNQQITSYGNVILRRFEGNATAQSVLQGAINDYQVQRQANSLIPSFYGNFTPKEKLDALNAALQGQPADVVARAMQNPSVQQWLKDAVAWIKQPYNGVSSQNAAEDQQAALQASQNLADITSDLPPATAQQIVQQCMPTIRQIASVDANYSGYGAFANLSKVVANLGDGAQASQLTSQIAQAYHQQFNTWEGRFDDPKMGIVHFAVGNGADPKLSIVLASQLLASGQTDQAGAVIRSVESGIEFLQDKVNQDVQNYNNQIKGFSWAVANSSGVLDPSQITKAVSSYVTNQSPQWQSQYNSIKNQLVADATTLNNSITSLWSIRGGALAKTAPDAFANLTQNVAANATTQQAISFAATQNPWLFSGSKGSAAVDFWADNADRNKTLMGAIANNYIADNLMPQIQALDNPNDPRAVAQLNQVLDDFQNKASKLLGIPPKQAEQAVTKLKEIIHTLGTTTSTKATTDAIKEYGEVNDELKELKDIQFTSGSAATVFRTLGFAIAGTAAIVQINGTLKDPTVQNIIGSFGQSVGAVQDGTAFAAKLGLIDDDSLAAQWGRAAKLSLDVPENASFWQQAAPFAGEATEKFVGLLDSAYFVAGGIQSFNQGDIPSAVLDGVGAGGAALAALGEAAGLGSWAGPVGIGITIFVQAGLLLTQHRETVIQNTAAEQTFLQDAGLSKDVAKTLSSDALQEASIVQQQLGLTPAEMQQLAAHHPEVFTMGPGYTQAVVDVANATGITGKTLDGFLTAAQSDFPQNKQEYIQIFFNRIQIANQPGYPLTDKVKLFDMIVKSNQFPHAASYVQAQSPGLVGPAADQRRQADVDYEAARGTIDSPEAIASLLASHSNPAYQAEIINIMNNNGTLKGWAGSLASYNWQTARGAIDAAVDQGLINPSQADPALQEIGGVPVYPG